jgi:hypothetical protein
MAHYKRHCYYRDEGGRLEPQPRETICFVAADDHDAVREARALPLKSQPEYFEVRSVDPKNRLIHTSLT